MSRLSPAGKAHGGRPPDALRMVYQPIVSTLDGRLHGVEALARFADGRPPNVGFREAAAAGHGIDLELRAVDLALDLDPSMLADGVYIAVNVGPDTMASPRLLPLVTGRPFPVVLELTEHVAFDDYRGLVRAVNGLREAGIRIAVDDAGSAYAGLAHILRLRPDFIKLDRSLISAISADAAKQALASAVSDFARSIDSAVIAEGVETMAELHAVVAAGVRLAQGYVIAEPSPAPGAVAAPVSSLRSPRVLVVDDDAVVRATLRVMLDKGGFDVVAEADDVAPAVGYAKALQPDVVILDLHMPSGRSDGALPLFRAAAPDAALIVISGGRASISGEVEPDAFMPKDAGLADVAARVRSVLAQLEHVGRQRPHEVHNGRSAMLGRHRQVEGGTAEVS